MLNIFILNWNSAADVESLLQSLDKSDYRKFRVLLIHNATADEAEIVRLHNQYQTLFDVHLIINNENYGYAGGNNQGFEYIQENELAGDILILNPDVTVQPNTLLALINAKHKTAAGAVMIRTYDETHHHLYDFVTLTDFKQAYRFSDENICESDYAAGSCLYLDRSLINEIGLFDPAYFMYWEEVDLSLRIKAQGKKIVSVTDSFIIRKSNPSERSGNAIYYSIRNSFILKHKFHFERFSHFYYALNMLLSAVKLSIVNTEFRYFLCFIKGFKAGRQYNAKNKS